MKRKFTKTKAKKVSKNFIGITQLRNLPSNRTTFFRLVKKDGTLSKKVYMKQKGDWNPFSKRFDISPVDDVWGAGREMKGTTKVSTDFEY